MARHFLVLYALIVVTLIAVSWGQDKLLQAYDNQDDVDNNSLTVATSVIKSELQLIPESQWQQHIATINASSGLNLDLLKTRDIAGERTLNRIHHGKIAYLQTASGESWALRQLDTDHVLAVKSIAASTSRKPMEWLLTAIFYVVIALVIMSWVWPITRDLRALVKSAAQFGDRNWSFNVDVKARSQIYPLAQTFRRMAARIDRLIASHKDMSNAVAHEIKTPLSRMQFEIEIAQRTDNPAELKKALVNIKGDIAAMDALITATLNYAILERADLSLNVGEHDFTTLIPAIVAHVSRDLHGRIGFQIDSSADANKVSCDVYLFETLLKNLLYNASHYATGNIHVTFLTIDGMNHLAVEDDGPGIPEKDWQRVFDSFVQLEQVGARKTGFGLGLAIVKRIVEWHHGEVLVTSSSLGGARFLVTWPALFR